MHSVVSTRWKAGDVLASLLLIATLTALYFLSGDVRYFYENAMVENGQLCFLAAALAILCWVARNQATELATAHFTGISLFVMTVLVREADVRHTWAEPYLGSFFADRLEFVTVGILWIVWAVVFRRMLPALVRTSFHWLLQPAGWAFIVGPALYLAGDLAEKHLIVAKSDMSEILEECLELLGTYSFFLSGYLSARHMAAARAPEVPAGTSEAEAAAP